MSSAVLVGLGVAGTAFGVRMGMRAIQQIRASLPKDLKLPVFSMTQYYKGGFDSSMSKREASLILGVSPASNMQRIRESHRRIMIVNHPDKGGSPFLASKINQAKDVLEGKVKSKS